MQKMSPAKWNELESVTKDVNRNTEYRTDRSLYNLEEFWEIADREGDCEDYALKKRKLLLEMGWPADGLRIAVVRTDTGEGHAVLTVDTDMGAYVLDNMTDKVMPWRETTYYWIARQKAGSRDWEFIR